MKYLIATLVLSLAASFSVAAKTDISKLSLKERQLLVGSTYLSQCAIRSSNFKAISSDFKPEHIKFYGKSGSGRDKYYDSFASSMVHLGDDACIVEIATQDFDKFVGSIPSLVTVLGGDLKLTKGKNGYSGEVNLNGKPFLIRAFSDGAKENNIVTGAIIRK